MSEWSSDNELTFCKTRELEASGSILNPGVGKRSLIGSECRT